MKSPVRDPFNNCAYMMVGGVVIAVLLAFLIGLFIGMRLQ